MEPRTVPAAPPLRMVFPALSMVNRAECGQGQKPRWPFRATCGGLALQRRLSYVRVRRGTPKKPLGERLPSGVDVVGQVLASQGGASGDEFGGGSLENDAAAIVAGPRSEVDDPIRVGHHCLVMLDHDH